MIKRTAIKRSTKPIRKVSTKRRRQLGQYTDLRKEYLAKHPWCEVYCKRFKVNYPGLFKTNGIYLEHAPSGSAYIRHVPLSTDIHHVAGRIGEKLNDSNDWLAACREQHEWIHNNPKEARALGVLK